MSASVSANAMHQMNLTPLVDVLLVLLVIFMVTAPAMNRPLSTALPQPVPADKVVVKKEPAQLVIAEDGSYRLDGKLVSLMQLQQDLEDAASVDKTMLLTIQAAASTDYQTMVSALSVARRSGVNNISVAQP